MVAAAKSNRADVYGEHDQGKGQKCALIARRGGTLATYGSILVKLQSNYCEYISNSHGIIVIRMLIRLV